MAFFVGRLSCRRHGACKTRALRFVGLAAWIFSDFASAQAPRVSDQAFHFTVFSARPLADLAFVPRAGAPPVKLVFYPTARSPRYEFRGAPPLRLVDGPSGAVLAEAVVPPEIREALLLLTPIEPSPTSGLRYRVAVLDDGAARHGPGGLAIINFSGLTLSGFVGRSEVTLEEGLNPTLAVGHSAKVQFRTPFKGRSYQSYTDTVELNKNERALLILFPPFYKGSLEVQSRLLIDEPPKAPVPAGGR